MPALVGAVTGAAPTALRLAAATTPASVAIGEVPVVVWDSTGVSNSKLFVLFWRWSDRV